VGQGVDGAQQRPDDRAKPAQAVALEITRQVGVVGGDDREAEQPSGEQGPEPEADGPDDVDDVGAKTEETPEDARIRQTDARSPG
jgi:hypothetical protein